MAEAEAPPVSKKSTRAPRAGWVGPLFSWELVRLARRGQDARARFLLAAIVLIVLTLFMLIRFWGVNVWELFFGTDRLLSIQESARFAEQFTLTFLIAQMAVMVLLTPAYAVGGLAEEKERKTLPFLLVTDLSNREIVMGKFFGRLGFLLGVMFAGLPILTLTMLYGGVSGDMLFVSYCLTTSTTTLLAAIGTAAAVAANTFRGALFRAYGLTALHTIVGCVHPFLSPFAVLLFIANFEVKSPELFYPVGLGYAALQLFAAIVALRLAVVWLRRQRAKPLAESPPMPPPTKLRAVSVGKAVPVARRVVASENSPGMDSQDVVLTEADLVEESAPKDRVGPIRIRGDQENRDSRNSVARRSNLLDHMLDRPPIDDDDPFLWKELHVTGVKRTVDDESIGSVATAVGICAGLLGLFLIVIALFNIGSTNSWSAWLFTAVGAGALFARLLTLGTFAAGTIVRERQRLTLESLFAIPVDRGILLEAKRRASIERGYWFGIAAAAAFVLGFALGPVRIAALPMIVYAYLAARLTASFGIHMSSTSTSNTRATLGIIALAGFLSIAPLLLLDLVSATPWGVGVMVLFLALCRLGEWSYQKKTRRRFEGEEML